jgi:RimJ/RimL family protein N-acetyltransferase
VAPDWPIETERLVLRPYEEGDFGALHELYSDEGVTTWLLYGPATESETRTRLARKVADRELDEHSGISVVVALRDGTYVGDLGIWFTSVEHRSAEVGFSFLPAHQGRGYATEATRALLDWAFATGGVHRVEGRLEARNAASGRVLEKLGMRGEAHFVENEWIRGEWQSELVYAILEREWPR